MKFNKDMTISEALEVHKDAQAVFMGFGMHCLGCPMSTTETIEEASESHAIDLQLMLEKLNELE